MFTGIIEAVGQLKSRTAQGGDQHLNISSGTLDLSAAKMGDSIAVSGVCLTVVELSRDGSGFAADVSTETLSRTLLGDLTVGAAVNLEQALTPSSRMGGHMVSGHVDGIGELTRLYQDARSWRFHIQAPPALARYIAEKGSICVDGVSLTVNAVHAAEFEVNIVPHTLQATTLGEYRVGRRVNLEVDIIARHLERLLTNTTDFTTQGLSEDLLRERGFI